MAGVFGLGDVIQKLRKERGHRSMVTFAARVGLNKATMTRIESGKIQNPETATVEKIARGLKMSPAELWALVPPPMTAADLALMRRIVAFKALARQRIDQVVDTLEKLNDLTTIDAADFAEADAGTPRARTHPPVTPETASRNPPAAAGAGHSAAPKKRHHG